MRAHRFLVPILGVLSFLAAGCIDAEGTLCDPGNVCGEGYFCASAEDGEFRCFAGEGPTADAGADAGTQADAGTDGGGNDGGAGDAGVDDGGGGDAGNGDEDGGVTDCEEGTTRPCGSDEGACSSGIELCTDGGWGTCSGTGPDVESCNGQDDDCDGQTDEAATGGVLRDTPCELNLGVCTGALRACVNGEFEATCTQQSYGPDWEDGLETRCDGMDNDCNGVVDVSAPRYVADASVNFRWVQFDAGYGLVLKAPNGGITYTLTDAVLEFVDAGVVSTQSTDLVSDVAATQGGALIAWSTVPADGGRDVRVTRLNATGAIDFDTLVEHLNTVDLHPQVSANHSGSAIAVVWRSTFDVLHGRVLTAQGEVAVPGAPGIVNVTCSDYFANPPYSVIGTADVTSTGTAVDDFLVGCGWGVEGGNSAASVDRRGPALSLSAAWKTFWGASDYPVDSLVMKPIGPDGSVGINYVDFGQPYLAVDKGEAVAISWQYYDFGPTSVGPLVVYLVGTDLRGRQWPDGLEFVIATDASPPISLASGAQNLAAVAFRQGGSTGDFHGVLFCPERLPTAGGDTVPPPR